METETKTTSREVLAIYRCKRCEKALKATGIRRPLVAKRISVLRTSTSTTTWGACGMKTSRLSKFTYNGATSQYLPSIQCDAGHNMVGDLVCGTYNAEVRCNTKCQGATGHDCECSCGGTNHGASFDAAAYAA